MASAIVLSSCSFSGKITSTASQSALASPYQLSVSDKIVPEYGIASLTVSLTQAHTQNISFTYYTQNQTAASGTDYVGVSGTASIPAGQTQVVISVPVADNYVKTTNKTFFFNISSATNAEISSASSIVQIQDDDYSAMTGVAQIATGGEHTCTLSTSGGVKCWGNNPNGQLGDSTTIDRVRPGDVTGLTSGVSSISTGYFHTCALTTGGGVKCWGMNSNGRLGDGTTTQRNSPVDVTGLTSGVAAISAGESHTCALTSGGGVKCWGWNTYGQLGDGTTSQRTTAVDVTGLTSGVAAISSGQYHTCALTTGAAVRCWGYNGYGQLGDSTTTDRTTSVPATGLGSGVASISAGYNHTCAVTTTSTAKCWGQNSNGQVGDGTTTQRNSQVNAIASGALSISAGSNHTCAVISGGAARCWGNNASGEVGDGTTTQRNSQVGVSGLSTGVASVSTGNFYSCAVLTGGSAKCWGENIYGQIGDGTSALRNTANDVFGLSTGVSAISESTNSHTCILTTSGGVKCWGDNGGGQIGDGTTTQRKTPVDVSGLTSGVIAISTGSVHSCALTSSGGMKCWGNNPYGTLGDGTTTARSTPVDVSGLTSGVSAITSGGAHSCALTTAGGAKCWGNNIVGAVGDGTTTQRNSQVNVSGLTSGVAAISAGEFHTCALTSAGAVRCWGDNTYGQVGDGTTTQRNSPVSVTGLSSGVIGIFTGRNHSCALTSGGGLKCWGENTNGQLGDGTTTHRNTPVDVVGLGSNVATVSAGYDQTCIVNNSGGAKCWGNNASGQLGDGTIISRTTAVDVSALSTGIAKVTTGTMYSCALTSLGGVKCWGYNYYGQIGYSYNSTVPIDVVAP